MTGSTLSVLTVLPCPALQPWICCIKGSEPDTELALKILCLRACDCHTAKPFRRLSPFGLLAHSASQDFSACHAEMRVICHRQPWRTCPRQNSMFAAVCFTNPPLDNMKNEGLGLAGVWLLPLKS